MTAWPTSRESTPYSNVITDIQSKSYLCSSPLFTPCREKATILLLDCLVAQTCGGMAGMALIRNLHCVTKSDRSICSVKGNNMRNFLISQSNVRWDFCWLCVSARLHQDGMTWKLFCCAHPHFLQHSHLLLPWATSLHMLLAWNHFSFLFPSEFLKTKAAVSWANDLIHWFVTA